MKRGRRLGGKKMIRHIMIDEELPMSFEIAPLPKQPLENEHQFAELVWERAIRVVKRVGDHAPMGVFKTEGTFILVDMDFRDELKDRIVLRLHRAAQQFKAQSFAMVMTMWFLDDPTFTKQCIEEDIRPAHHIKRKEGLLVEAQGQTGERIIIGEIVRGENRKVEEIIKKEWDGMLTVQSRFTGIITRGVA